jgi:hypothetical protein
MRGGRVSPAVKNKLFLSSCPVCLVLLAACGAAPAVRDPGPAAPVVEYVSHQEILTPLPLRVRLPQKSGAEHVVVLFRTWGNRGWRQMELGRAGQTWSGEVSCRDVSTVTGDTKYFFVALDQEGELVGGSGSPDWPHVATIVGKLPDGPQSLPGGTIPMRCHDPADCPPDFPGCPAYAVKRRACRTSEQCPEGLSCAWDGYCGSASAEIEPLADESDEEQLAHAVRTVKERFKKTASR